MAYALLCIGSMTIANPAPNVYDPVSSTYVTGPATLSVNPGTIVNLIDYDGVSAYNPGPLYTLVQIPDGKYNIGQTPSPQDIQVTTIIK